MKRGGFRHTHSLESIMEYRLLSAEDKLNWLEAANRFSHKAINGKRKQIWEKFRRGEI